MLVAHQHGRGSTGAPFSRPDVCGSENDAWVVPDEFARGNVIQMAPFSHRERTPVGSVQRPAAVLPYHYGCASSVRMRSGRTAHSRSSHPANSRLAGNAALQGRDLVYLLPPQTIRVLSMVPADAADVRDASGEAFGGAESLENRARVLEILALTLVALGALMVLLTLVRLVRGARRTKPVGERTMGSRRLVRLAADELAEVQRETERLGWDASASSVRWRHPGSRPRSPWAGASAKVLRIERRTRRGPSGCSTMRWQGQRTSWCRARHGRDLRGKSPGPGRLAIQRRGRPSSAFRGAGRLAALSDARNPWSIGGIRCRARGRAEAATSPCSAYLAGSISVPPRAPGPPSHKADVMPFAGFGPWSTPLLHSGGTCASRICSSRTVAMRVCF